jgi:hypothetical protein
MTNIKVANNEIEAFSKIEHTKLKWGNPYMEGFRSSIKVS